MSSVSPPEAKNWDRKPRYCTSVAWPHRSSSARNSLNWVSPSSIHVYRFSSDPTIMGNHMWATSWTVTL